MSVSSKRPGVLVMLAMAALPVSGTAIAQQQDPLDPDVTVNGTYALDEAVEMTQGPEVDGIITARSADRVQITTADGANTIISVNDATRIQSSKGLFGLSRTQLASDALLNGLPVTVKTLQSPNGLVASQIKFKNNDFKTAAMIRNGTNQRFEEQAAATEALRGRMADIDKYNIKDTVNVNFDTGKANLSPQAQAALCQTAASAEGIDNALLLVVGYTDSTGSYEFNQELSEKRAARVINYLQQACGWKPYRMLTPTGMAMADPLASNDTEEGKAQNRRVAVNVLVSKGLDGI